MNKINNPPAFPNLNAEMARAGYSVNDLAILLKRDYRTAQNKVDGKGPFYRRDMVKIQKEWFPAISLDELFFTEIEV